MDAQQSLRAALYTRVSTEEQAQEGYSLDAQMSRLERHCDMMGWEIAGRYREEGHSGRTDKRPEYQRMMAEKNDWDVVLVLKMDRIHRDSVNFTKMIRDLSEAGKDFCSVQEDFDTSTALGRFVMDLVQRIAQLESEQIGERVKAGMEQKAKFGKGLLGSAHPYGYEYKQGKLEVNEDEKYVVRAMFKMYRDGYSTAKISEYLNDALITAKKGGKWNKQEVHKIVHNPIYIGYVKWDNNLRQGDHSAIIDKELFESINGPISNFNTTGGTFLSRFNTTITTPMNNSIRAPMNSTATSQINAAAGLETNMAPKLDYELNSVTNSTAEPDDRFQEPEDICQRRSALQFMQGSQLKNRP